MTTYTYVFIEGPSIDITILSDMNTGRLKRDVFFGGGGSDENMVMLLFLTFCQRWHGHAREGKECMTKFGRWEGTQRGR